MDWLTFKFCVLIWVLCVSRSQSQLLNSTSSLSSQLRSSCGDGQPIVPPDECNSCICFAGQKYCTNIPCPEPDCVNGVDVPHPDVCNKCICRRGKIKCTNMICIPAPNCAEKQLYPAQNKCNACMCMNGFITCTSNLCAEEPLSSIIPTTTTKKLEKKEKCIEGESLPGPGLECIECFCQNGEKSCKNVCPTMESRFSEVETLQIPEPECVPGQHLKKPDNCNNCICFEGEIHCTHLPCRMDTRIEQDCVNSVDIPRPDVCNKCICRRGKVKCTNMICIPAPNCVEKQLYPAQNKCNACICMNGFLTCTSNLCAEEPLPSTIPTTTTENPEKKEKCIEGESLPGPGQCIECFCQNGEKTCKNVCPTMESRFSEVETLQIPETECVPGQHLQRPDNCNLLPSTIPTTTTKKPKKKKKKCIEGESLPGPGQCIECFCQNGKKTCKNVCPTMESRFSEVETLQIPEPECVPGQRLQRPDPCNNCICIEGQIHCTDFPCRMDKRIGPECTDNQLVFRPDECNECYCFEGRLECSDLVCIRGSKCVQGQVIPKPDSCNACKCVEGHIMCTDYQCPIIMSRNALRPGRSSIEVRALHDECQEGDIISQPPPPNDCNMCYCMDNRILCTMNSCEGLVPEIKGRLQEPNEETDLEIFDKKISVEPFINMLSKNYEKLPTKLIHTHAYNGFHQEIKVHASHLPKDATKLLKVLATSLDNSALASISQKLLSSSHSLSNNHNSKIPLDNQVVPPKLLGEGNMLTTQSNKLITSGSQSNETILVIPNTEPLNDQDSQSVLPLTSKHETIWKSFSSPASQVFNNNQQINPHSSQEEKLNVYYYENPPTMFTPIDQNNVIRNPSKFGRPGLPHRLPTPTQPTRNIVEIPITNTQSIYPASNPKSININDVNKGYAPFSQENKQFKPIPSASIIKQDELPDPRPYQLIKPGHNLVFNYTSSTPIFRPGKLIVTPNNNGGQQKPSQSQFIPNLSKYYPNHVKPQKIQFKPNQNHLPTLNNKGIQPPPLFKNPIPLIVAANQFKQPQFGLKPGQGSVNPLYNKDNQTDQQFKVFHPNQQQFQISPPLINLPNQKKRISSTTNEVSKEIPPHSMVPNSTAHHTNILNPPQIGVDPEHTQPISSHSQFVPNPSIYYRNEYESPKIIDVNPDQEQLPHSKISYTHSEHYNPPHTSSEPDLDILIPKVRNKTKKYNTSHSHYEKHTTITYVSEYDPSHPANPLQIVHDPNQYQNAPQINVYEHYLPDQESQELDLIMSKVNYYLNLPNLQLDQNEPHPKFTHYYSSQTSYFPGQQLNNTLKLHPTLTETNKYNQHDSWNITNHQFDTYPHSPSDGNNTDPHSSSQSQFILSQDNSKQEGLNDQKSAEDPQSLSTSAEDPIHPKSNNLPPPFQTGHTQNLHPPGVLDDRGSTNEFQYAHNAYEDPRQLKPFHKFLPSKLETPQNQQLPEFLDERGSADGFQYPSNSAEDLTHPKMKLNKSPHFDPYTSIVNPEQPKDNIHIIPHSQFGPTQQQHKPGVFDNREVKDGFKYAHNADKNPTHLKLLHKHLPFPHPQTSFSPTLIQHSPEMFNERASADGFQYLSNSAENPIHSRGNLDNPQLSQFGSTQNQHLPGMFGERGFTDGFQYPSHSAENPLQPKDNQYNHPHPQFGPILNQHTRGMFDEVGSGDEFHYPSNSGENPLHPKDKLNKLLHKQFDPTQNQRLPGVFDERETADGFQYISSSAENVAHSKENPHKPSNSPFGPTTYKHLQEMYTSNSAGNPIHLKNLTHPEQNKQKQPNPQDGSDHHKLTPGMFAGRGSPDSFQYSSNSPKNHLHPKDYLHYTPHSQFGPPQNKHLPGVFDNRGSPGDFQYPFNSMVNPTQLKDNLHNPAQSPFLPSHNQYTSGVFDDRGFAGGFKYPANSAENRTNSKDNLHNILPHSQFVPTQNEHKQTIHKQPNSPHGPTQNQHLPGIFDKRLLANGFQHPSHSAENLLEPKHNQYNHPHPQFGPIQNQHIPGEFAERGSADSFQYPSYSAENPTNPIQNKQKQPNSPLRPAQNLHLPGMFDERGTAHGFQYRTNSVENPTHPKQNNQMQSYSPFGPAQHQHLPGMFDDRGSNDGFQYPSNSVENPTRPKDNLHKLPQSQLVPSPNQHIPGVFDDRGSADGFQYSSNSAENPTHPKQNNQIQSNSPFGPAQNQHLSGMFDERGSSDGFQYPSNSVENPTRPKDNLHKIPQSQFVPSPNQHIPGVFDDRGAVDGFQYPSNSAENPTHPKQNKNMQSNSPFGPAQHQHIPGMFDDRGSNDGFQYPSNSVENPTRPKDNLHKLPQSQFVSSPNQHIPGVLDDRGSTDGFQYPSNSAENPTHPKQNNQMQSYSPFGPAQHQHLPGMFDERGSSDGFQYPSNSVENPTRPKDNLHKIPQSQFVPSSYQHIPGVFDDRGSADGFQYPSNSAENPTDPKQNKNMQSNSLFGPAQHQHLPGMFDDRGSNDGFQYPSNSVENPTRPKDNLHKLPQSQFVPSPNQHIPGVFDDRGSADGFQYPSNSAENPTHPKQNNQMQSYSPFGPAQHQHLPGMFDERGSSDGFQYPSHSAENPLLAHDNQLNPVHPQFGPNQNQHTPGVLDDRGSADGFQYPSNSAENPTHPKQNNQMQSNSPFGPAQNQHLPGMFDERGSSDGFQYPSHSAENPLLAHDNQLNPVHPQFGPNQNQHTPGVFDDRGSADGFHYPSNSVENPSHAKNITNTTPDSKFQLQNEHKPSSLDDGYNNNNPLRPWMHLDHDQYKPSSFDNLLNGVHNIPWSFSGNHNTDSDTVTSAPEPTPNYDRYKPSSFDNLFNGIPWSVPNQDNNALGSDAEITTPHSGFKPKQDQYEPPMVTIPSISNQNENMDFTDVDDNQLQIEQDVSTPTELTDSDSTQYNLLPLKPDSDPDSGLLTDSGKIPDYYDQLYPLFKAVKKLSDPPIDDSIFGVGSMDQLDLLPFLFPGIAKILNYEPSQGKDDVSPDENYGAQRINPLSKLKSKLKQLPENDNGILNWLKSKLNKLVPKKKDNATVTKNDIDMTKIFNLLSKLTPPKLKHTTALQNIPFSGFDPEIIENIMNDFKEDTLTTTLTPLTDSTHSYENRFMSVPTIPEENRPQAPQLKYPDVHIILHQPNDEDGVDLPPYIEADGELNSATDIDSKELSASMFPKMFNPRFRHRPKDQKEECGDGTQWISNCHGCSCYFGQAMCFRLPDCKLRPFGEPMTCKPYSHFKMGCYTCECNGDGVAECDASDCSTEPNGKSRVSGSTESPLPIFNEFFDSKKTNDILQYYNFYKKLPKDCPKQDLQTEYPTCEPGTSWVSSCHKCECNKFGKHECMKIDDCKLDFDSFGKPGQCKPNSKFYPKTNSMPCVECSCNDEGISYCPAVDYKKH